MEEIFNALLQLRDEDGGEHLLRYPFDDMEAAIRLTGSSSVFQIGESRKVRYP
jgi:hypothetical protein